MAHDVIVAGVGGMGSAAACHLARRGLRVLALERRNVVHDFGSSHGLTRIIRLAYFEHPSYVPLLQRAYELWRDLEDRTRRQLLFITGGLDVGWEGSGVFDGALRSCRDHSLAHEVLSDRELTRRFPGWDVPERTLAVFQPDGGFLLAEECVDSHAGLAVALGAEVREDEPVLDWDATPVGVRVRTPAGTYEAGQLVVAAGAWCGALVPELRAHLTPERQVFCWFATKQPKHFDPAHFPVFILDDPSGHYYGFPAHQVPGFKIGRFHHRYEAVDPDLMDRETNPEDEAVLRAVVKQYFPNANGPLLRAGTCLFTNTPDEHFIIDRHPVYSQVLLVSPCSGHGFKFCSVVGEIVADLVERGATPHDISLFRLSRFASPP
jgi:sarcosine oxidase